MVDVVVAVVDVAMVAVAAAVDTCYFGHGNGCRGFRTAVITHCVRFWCPCQHVSVCVSLFLGCLGQVSSSMITLNKVVKGLKLQGLLVEVGFC